MVSFVSLTGNNYVISGNLRWRISEQEPGLGGEIQLTDAIAMLQQSEPVEAYRMKGRTFDCGSKSWVE